MSSNHTIGAYSLEHKEGRYGIIIGEECCTFWLIRYRTPSGGGKYIGFGLKIETGAERTTLVDIFDIIQKVRDTGIHLKVDEEPRSSRGLQQ